jgi:hypothetical protein
LLGGPAPQSARRELDIFSARLEGDQTYLDDIRRRVEDGQLHLETAIDALVN